MFKSCGLVIWFANIGSKESVLFMFIYPYILTYLYSYLYLFDALEGFYDNDFVRPR